MGKKIPIKTTCLQPARSFDKESGSGSPEDVTGIVVLSPVRLHPVKHPPPAERKTKGINVPSGSTRMFKPFPIVKGSDLRLCRSHIRILFKQIDHRTYPILC